MLQYIIVFAAVAIAGLFVVGKLIGQAKGKSCGGECHCACDEEHEKP